jgi:hypothetical protein
MCAEQIFNTLKRTAAVKGQLRLRKISAALQPLQNVPLDYPGDGL